MRQDFNKILVERERHGHDKKFHEHRRMKVFDRVDGPGGEYSFGGREGMRRRHKQNYDMKHFNENLNPLKGFLRSKIGKKWDKIYSELRTTFDARSVINKHILEHLFQYVEINAVLIGGRVMVLEKYRSRTTEDSVDGYVPIKKSFSEYYVCPKDGTLKVVNKPPKRAVANEKAIREQREKDAVFRELDARTHLRLVDGVWFAFELADLPEPTIQYVKPAGKDDFRSSGWNSKRVHWDELSADQQKTEGTERIVAGSVFDVFTKETMIKRPGHPAYRSVRRYGVYSYGVSTPPVDKYYATKRTASHKELKVAGIIV